MSNEDNKETSSVRVSLPTLADLKIIQAHLCKDGSTISQGQTIDRLVKEKINRIKKGIQ